MSQIMKCKECDSYGLSEECTCGSQRLSPNPPKFNIQDKYAKYRIEYKKEKGLL